MLKEGGATRRKLHAAGRALDEPAAETLFEALELQADRGLRRLHDFSRAREAVELGDADEGPDGIQVERALCHFRALSLISISIARRNG